MTEVKATNTKTMDERNRQFYERPETVAEYAQESQLWPEERFIFDLYSEFIVNRRVLDIGCGGGRTTGALLERTPHYVGLDYSEPMVQLCRRRWPAAEFIHGDASALHMFGANEFDFVLFSFNGIDSMSHEKRLAVLREVYRVLKPGGVFAFSSHNRDDKHIVTAWNLRDWSLHRNLRNLRSYLSVRKAQVVAASYAILSDPLAGEGYLTYYIRKHDQVRQLGEAGFRDVTIINQGCEIVPAETRDRLNQWFHYVARR